MTSPQAADDVYQPAHPSTRFALSPRQSSGQAGLAGQRVNG